MIHVVCSSCREHLNVPDEFAGRSGRCNFCGCAIVIPFASAQAPSMEDVATVVPYAAPRRPTRPGAGMIASEGERGGGAGVSLGRIVLLAVLAIAVTACLLPAIVIGFSAETKPEESSRPTAIPSARGTSLQGALPPPVEAPVQEAVEKPAQAPAVDEKRVVLAGPRGGAYHKADCRLAGEGAKATTLRLARERGLVPCSTCGD